MNLDTYLVCYLSVNRNHKIKLGITVYKNEVKSLISKFYCCKNLGMLNLKILLSAKTYSNQKKEWAELRLGSSALFGYL